MFKKWIKPIFCAGFALLYCFLCVGYAALQDDLSITGTVSAEGQSGVPGGNRMISYATALTFSSEQYENAIAALPYAEKSALSNEWTAAYTKWPYDGSNATYLGIRYSIALKYIQKYSDDYFMPYGAYLFYVARSQANTNSIIFGKYSEYEAVVSNYHQFPMDEANSGGILLCYPYDLPYVSDVYVLVDDSQYSRILAPTDSSQMFCQAGHLKNIEFNGILDTGAVTDMYQMFGGCASLETLDLSSFDTSKVTNMAEMFSTCPFLKTVYVSESFVTNKVRNGTDMFSGCVSLAGGNGTTLLSLYYQDTANAYTHKYARIDGGPNNPGYFTEAGSPLSLEEPAVYSVPRPTTQAPAYQPPVPTLRTLHTQNLTVTLTDDGIDETTTLTVIPDEGYALSDTFTVSFGGLRYVIYTKPEHAGSNPQGMGFDALSNTLTISNTLLPSGAFELIFTGVATARYK